MATKAIVEKTKTGFRVYVFNAETGKVYLTAEFPSQKEALLHAEQCRQIAELM